MTYTTHFKNWLVDHYTERLEEEVRPEAKAYLIDQLNRLKQ